LQPLVCACEAYTTLVVGDVTLSMGKQREVTRMCWWLTISSSLCAKCSIGYL